MLSFILDVAGGTEPIDQLDQIVTVVVVAAWLSAWEGTCRNLFVRPLLRDSRIWCGSSPLAKSFSRSLEFMAAVPFGLVAQRAYGRDELTRFEPVHEIDDIRVDDRLCLRDCTLARIQPFLDNFRKVIHGIEKYVVQFAPLRARRHAARPDRP